MKRLLLSVILASCFSSPWILAVYRADLWNGEKSDQAVQMAGYAYYFCDPNGNGCYAVYLANQESQDLLRKIRVHRGKTVEDTIDIVRRDSELAANVLRDFKQYRRINSMKEVLLILEGRK